MKNYGKLVVKKNISKKDLGLLEKVRKQVKPI